MVYAITFALDVDQLKQVYPSTLNWQTAYSAIKKILAEEGFVWRQDSLYFGTSKNAVDCVLATQRLSKELSWFKACVKDIQMLRIEEMTDLKPAL